MIDIRPYKNGNVRISATDVQFQLRYHLAFRNTRRFSRSFLFGEASSYVILNTAVEWRIPHLQYIAVALYLLVVTLHLFACASRDRLMLRRITKCCLMPLLLMNYTVFAAVISPLVVAAILCGFVGDVFLLFRPRHWSFPAGIFSFAAGHVFYIIRFLESVTISPAWYVCALLVTIGLLSAIVLLRYLWKGLPKKLRPPSFLYMLIIATMASSAILFALYGNSPQRWLAAVGGLFFVASDSTLSIDAFHHPVRYRNVIVMSTYIAAQTMMVASLAAA